MNPRTNYTLGDFRVTRDPKLSKREVVWRLWLPEGDEPCKLKTIKLAIQHKQTGPESQFGWIKSVRIDGRSLLIYSKIRTNTDKSFRRSIRRYIGKLKDVAQEASMAHEQLDPHRQTVTRSALRKVEAKVQPQRRQPAQQGLVPIYIA